MSAAENEVRLVGRPEPAPTPVTVEVGRISLEIEDRALRSVRIDGLEVISRLYVGIRDPVWDTLVGELVEDDLQRNDQVVTYTCSSVHRGGDIDFAWQGTAHAHADGSLEFVMDGIAKRAFDYARIGLNLLSPGEFGGLPYRVTTPGGLHGGVLPQTEIAAQPFIDGEFYPMTPAFSELSVFPPSGEIRFQLEGDLFEIEDQRNWTDATFKTYSTPMSLGMRHAQAGEVIRQRLVVTPPPAPGRRRRVPRDCTILTPAWDKEAPRPAIGLCHTLTDRTLSQRERELLRPLRLTHLRVEMSGVEAPSTAGLELATSTARELDARIELALQLTGEPTDGDLETLRAALDTLPIDRLLVFDTAEFVTPGDLTRRVRESLGDRFPVYGGTNLNFADVNRQRPDPSTCDGIAFSINPQVHAFDDRSLVETLSVQGDVVRAARATFAAATPLAVSPVTLRPRFNPDAPDQLVADSGLPYAVDPRQPSLFCASWTVGSIAHLTAAGANSLTYFGTAGWRGVVERDEGADAPELFHSSPGDVYPVYHVFRAIAEYHDARSVPVRSSDPLAVVALGRRDGTSSRMLVANVTPDVQRFRIEGGPTASARRRTLDAATVGAATSDPDAWIGSSAAIDAIGEIELSAYATAVIDFRA